MNVWVLQAPRAPGMAKPQYVAHVDARGVQLVPHMILARRFTEARHARAWASQHPLLEDFVPGKPPDESNTRLRVLLAKRSPRRLPGRTRARGSSDAETTTEAHQARVPLPRMPRTAAGLRAHERLPAL